MERKKCLRQCCLPPFPGFTRKPAESNKKSDPKFFFFPMKMNKKYFELDEQQFEARISDRGPML
jgi:hypothetical protein